ncbi:hypothetical protein K435DRAFT_561793, partial [Dendrothele bispora CBS 962.96]
LIQLRTGHIPLNAHLNKIKKSPTENCRNCKTKGIPRKEDVKHLIYECPTYSRHRQKLKQRMGRLGIEMKALYASEDNMKDLLKFIRSTERLNK